MRTIILSELGLDLHLHYNSFVRAAEAPARLHTHGGLTETPLLADAISTNISCTCTGPLTITKLSTADAQIRLCTNSAVKIYFQFYLSL